MIQILVPPSIQTQSSFVYASIGTSIQIHCSSIGPFDTKIYWHRLDRSNTNDNHKVKKLEHQQYIIGDITQTILTIKDVNRIDFGLYGCVAESMAGQSHAVIELKGRI